MIALPNGLEFLETVFAVWKCGAVPNPMSAKAPLPELQQAIDLSKPSMLVGGPAGLRAPVHIVEGFDDFASFSHEALESVVSPHWKALGTGGSTGKPKLIVFHTPAKFSPTRCNLGQQLDGTVLNPGPLYHNAAFTSSMLGLFTGNHVIVTSRFDAEGYLQLVEQYRVDHTVIVPTMMSRIWRLGEEVRKKYDVSSIRLVLHQASFCPEWVKQAWIDWFGPEKIIEAYGASEVPGSTVISGTEWLQHRGSVGRVQPGSSLVILDPGWQASTPARDRGGLLHTRRSDTHDVSLHWRGAAPSGRRGDSGRLRLLG